MTNREENFAELLRKYRETEDVRYRGEIAILYSDIVKYVAVSTRNMYIKYCEPEDVVNEGMLSIMKAVDSFDEKKNVSFATYATIRVRGAVIDFIRNQDNIPRGVRKLQKELDNVYNELYIALDREPTEEEIAQKLNISTEKVRKAYSESASLITLSFEDMLCCEDFDISASKDTKGIWDAEKGIFREELRKMLTEAIENLKDQQKTVIALYYYEKLKFSEIAEVMDVSESRVCQIHGKAMQSLKQKLLDYIKE